MHCCLSIAEVLQAVADNVDHRGSLLYMSLTCRALHDPAMNALWRELDDPQPLILVLPSADNKAGESERRLSIAKPPTEAEWQRFYRYASRVRVLRYRSETDSNYYEDDWSIDWEAILKYYRRERLLPNLRKFGADYDLKHQFYPLFVQPSVRHLSLTYWEMYHLESLLVPLLECAQTLEHLKIKVIGEQVHGTPQILRDISKTVSQMRALSTLHIGPLLPDALSQVASFPALRELDFVVDWAEATSSLSFPTLERVGLHTHIADCSPVLSIVQRLHAPSLRHVSVGYRVKQTEYPRAAAQPPAAVIKDVISAIAHLEQLRGFDFDVHSFLPPTQSDPTLPLDALEPFLSNGKFEHLNLSNVTVPLDASDISRIARGWPNAKCIRISDIVRDVKSPIHFEDLEPFATHCPHLQTLGIPLASPPLAQTEAVPRQDVQGHSLRNLRINDIDLGNYTDIARFLSGIFPHVQLGCLWVSNGPDRDSVNRQLKRMVNPAAYSRMATIFKFGY